MMNAGWIYLGICVAVVYVMIVYGCVLLEIRHRDREDPGWEKRNDPNDRT